MERAGRETNSAVDRAHGVPKLGFDVAVPYFFLAVTAEGALLAGPFRRIVGGVVQVTVWG